MCDVVLLVRWTVTLRSAILVLLSQDCVVHTDDSTLEHMKGGTVSMRGRQCPYITWNSVWEYLSILPNYFLFTHLFTYVFICFIYTFVYINSEYSLYTLDYEPDLHG